MKNDAVVKIRRVHWKSQIAGIAAACGGMALLNIIPIIRSSNNFWDHLLIVLIMLAIGGPSIFTCLQTVVITAEDIQLKIACIILRRIPISEIHTIVYLPPLPHLDRLEGNYLVLSTKTQEHIRTHGEAVVYSDPYIREKLIRLGRKSEEPTIKVRTYFLRRLKCGVLSIKEGIWVSTSIKNIERIRNLCSHAVYLTTW